MRFSQGRRALRLALGLAGALALPAVARADMLDSLNPMNWFSGDKYKTEIVPETPADDLYNQGLARLKVRDYAAASKSFETLQKQYPYSQWQRKALLMATFSQYQAGNYDDAIGSAKRYLGLYPNAPDVDYATYLEAMSYYNQIPRRQPRSGAGGQGVGSILRNHPEIPQIRICRGFAVQASGYARPARRQGDDDRALLSQSAQLHRGRRPLPRSAGEISDDPPCRGGADAAGPKPISRSASRRKRRRRRRSLATIIPTSSGTRTPIRSCRRMVSSPTKTRAPGFPRPRTRWALASALKGNGAKQASVRPLAEHDRSNFESSRFYVLRFRTLELHCPDGGAGARIGDSLRAGRRVDFRRRRRQKSRWLARRDTSAGCWLTSPSATSS